MRARLADPPPGSGLAPVYGGRLPGLLEQILFTVFPDRMNDYRIQNYGEISFNKFLGRTFVTVTSPEAAEVVMANRDKVYANEPAWDFLIGVAFRRGILLMDFAEHHHHRRIMQQAFTPTHLKGYFQEMEPLIAHRISTLPGGEVQLVHEFKAIALDVALEVFLGAHLPRRDADVLNQAFIHCMEGLSALVRRPIPGGRYRRALRGRAVLERFFYDQLPAKRARETPDLFSVLCRAESEDGHRFTDEDVVNHMIFVLFAAHDTTTAALGTMAYHLARHPEWLDRVRAQSAKVEGQLGYDGLASLTDLELVMKEALRLNPPVPTFVREALTDTELDGRFIPKGTYVSVAPLGLHRNPRIWPEPKRFDPERFAPDRREDKVHRYAWAPFGGGVHKCIGLHFAQMEIKAMLHHLVQHFDWQLPTDYEWHTDPTTLGEPRDGLHVTLHPRP